MPVAMLLFSVPFSRVDDESPLLGAHTSPSQPSGSRRDGRATATSMRFKDSASTIDFSVAVAEEAASILPAVGAPSTRLADANTYVAVAVAAAAAAAVVVVVVVVVCVCVCAC